MGTRRRLMLAAALVAASACEGSVERPNDGGAGGARTSAASGSTKAGPGSGDASSSRATTATSSGTSAIDTTSSGDVSSSTDGAGGGLPVCTSFDTCTDCIAVSCDDTWCECSENPDCFPLFQCHNGCAGDAECAAACNQTYAGGVADAVLVSNCAGTACSASCDFGEPLSPCGVCLYDECEAEMGACVAVPQCTELYQCLTACPQLDLTCQQGCYDSSPDGVAPLQAVLMCSDAACQADCRN